MIDAHPRRYWPDVRDAVQAFVGALVRGLVGALVRHRWVVGFFLVYAALVGDVTIGRPYAFGDLPPYLGADALATFASTWHDDLLGFPHHYTTVSAYVGAITVAGGAVASVTGNTAATGEAAAQNLFLLSFVPGGFLAFALFAGRFVDDPVARYLAATVYAVNPITIGEFVNGGANEFLTFVGTPLVLHFLWRIAETDEWRPAVIAGMAFGATAVIPWTAFWAVAPFAAYLCYRHRDRPTVLGKFVGAGAVGTALSLPSVFYLAQRAVGLEDGAGGMAGHLAWNYREATPLSLLRLAGNHGSYAMTELGYNADPTAVVGLTIPAVALLAWPDRGVRFCYPIAGALVGFMALTHHGVTYPLFEVAPPLWSLRNPAKLQYPLLLSVSLLFGGGLGVVFDRIDAARGRSTVGAVTRRRGRAAGGQWLVQVAFVALVVISLFAYAAPANDGTLALETTRGDEYAVPAEYDDVSERVDGRVLWLPYSYTTQLRLRAAYPDHVGVQSGALETGKPNAAYVADLFRDVAAGEPVDERLADLGVRYVVVDGGTQERYPAAAGEPRLAIRHEAPWLFGDPATFADRLDADDDYRLAFATDRFDVYRVEGVPARDHVEQGAGLHRVYYPVEPSTEPVGESVVTNGDFASGLDGWWTWSGENGTRTTVVETDDGRSADMVTESGDTYPLSQRTAVRAGYPYRLDVDAVGGGTVGVYWYDGAKSAANLTARARYPLGALPRTLVARGDVVSIRVLPNASRLLVREVSLRRATYPPRTGFADNSAGIPGIVVDGRTGSVDAGAVVAVNLNASQRAKLDASVRIRDAETVLDGDLVLDENYRGGAAVLVDAEPETVAPEGAEVVARETPNGTAVDYWVVGEFDDRPVTVLDTSYDERWTAGPDSEHFEAYGWANGFTNATPDDVRWTGDGLRGPVIQLWLGLWGIVLCALACVSLAGRRRSRGGL